jgi:hypothetical protein
MWRTGPHEKISHLKATASPQATARLPAQEGEARPQERPLLQADADRMSAITQLARIVRPHSVF